MNNANPTDPCLRTFSVFWFFEETAYTAIRNCFKTLPNRNKWNPRDQSIEFVFEDLSLGTDVKQVPGVGVLNFDFVIPFAIPFHFQNVTRRVTGFDCFQYRPRQLANRNLFVRPARGYGYNESGQQGQATGGVHRQQCYLGPVRPDKPPKAAIARHIEALANHGGGYLVFGFWRPRS